MDKKYIIAVITAPNQEIGEIIANTLMVKKLVACVNFITPVVSLFFLARRDRPER